MHDALRWIAIACLCALTSAGAILGEGGLQGTSAEFQVNRYTESKQNAARIAMNGGGFVVVWQSDAKDGDDTGIFAQRFSSAGSQLGGEIQIAVRTVGIQRLPSVALEANGDFAVTWSQYEAVAKDDVYVRRFTSSGDAIGGEIQVNTYTTGFQLLPTIAADSDGDFVVVWQGSSQDDSYGVFGRRFNSSGAALGGELQINVYTPGSQKLSTVAMASGGSFVVAWGSQNGDGSSYGVFARRFESTGSAIATELQVNVYTNLVQSNPAIDIGADGAFVIVWRDYNRDGSEDGVFGRRFTSTGVPQAAEFQVSVRTIGPQESARVTIGEDGDFVVAWQGKVPNSSFYTVLARRFSSSGVPFGGEFDVKEEEYEHERDPAIGSSDDGRFVIVWEADNADGSDSAVFARFLASGVVLDVDADDTVEPLSDGLLFVRHAFGFSGPSLVGGAVTLDCERCDGPAVTSYLNGLGLTLDVDDDGEVEPLTDGLLVLRFLFGFSGSSLIAGAVDEEDCDRCDATAIAEYLHGLR